MDNKTRLQDVSAKSKIALFLPLIVGVPLGFLSLFKFPPTPPNLLHSGVMVLGGAVGYLLAALVVAYANAASWGRSFLTGSLTIVIATAVYYGKLTVSRLGGNEMVESYGAMAKDAVKWVALGVFVGALAAIAMRFAVHSKRKPLRLGALIVPYLFFCALAGIDVFYIVSRYHNPGYLTATWMGYNFYGDLYEAVWDFALSTILFVIGMTQTGKGANHAN